MVAKYPNGNAMRAPARRPPRPPRTPADFQKGLPPGLPANDNLPKVPKSVLRRLGGRLARRIPYLGAGLLAWDLYEAYKGMARPVTVPNGWRKTATCTGPGPVRYWSAYHIAGSCNGQTQATPTVPASLTPIGNPIGSGTTIIQRWNGVGEWNGTVYVHRPIDSWSRDIFTGRAPRPGVALPGPVPMEWPIHWPIEWPIGLPTPRPAAPPRPSERPGDNQEPGKGPDDDLDDRPGRNPRRRSRPRRREQYDLPPRPGMPPVIAPPGIDLPIVPPDLDFEIPIGSNPLNPPKIEWKPSRGDGSRPPSRRKHERKVNVAAVGGIVWTGFNAATEVMDFLEAMHDALPKNKQAKGKNGKPPSKTDKIDHIVSHPEHWGEINVAEAVQNVINNQIEDFVAAIGSKPIKRVTQEIGSATGLDRAIRSGSEPWSKGGPTIPELDIDTATGEVTITVKVGGYSKRVW